MQLSGRHEAVLQGMGFSLRSKHPAGWRYCWYDRMGRYTLQTVQAWYEVMTDSWWFAPRTIQWDPGIKFDTPEAAVAFAEVERWGVTEVQGTV